ncbi:MAG: hypothetical protein V4638_00480 [Bacteroidota bacterium]
MRLLIGITLVLLSFQINGQVILFPGEVLTEEDSISLGLKPAPADTILKKNTVYLEFLGQGLINSLSYDRVIHAKGSHMGSITAGVGFWYFPAFQGTNLSFSYNHLFGKTSHKLEIGLALSNIYLRGANFNNFGKKESEDVNIYSDNFFMMLVPKLGYRYQQPKGGFFARATLTPLIGLYCYYGKKKAKYLYDNQVLDEAYEETFPNTRPFSPWLVSPWGGISVGWTF